VPLLVATYALFALAAGARSGVQLATRAEAAPLPYGLSALAAALYLAAAVALHRGARRLAGAVLGVELAGVLGVGLVSLLVPDAFPEATVWSHFGAGYGWVPLVLPVLGLGALAARPAALGRPDTDPRGPTTNLGERA